MSEENPLMVMPGIIDMDEREFLRDMAQKAVKDFNPKINIVNIGVFMAASCYCLRVGAPEANLWGVDLYGWEKVEDTPEQREFLNMTFIVGDSREVHTEFDEPIHAIFIDGCHFGTVVAQDIQNWVLPYVVPGGYAAYHDARFSETSTFCSCGVEVSVEVDAYMTSDEWEELEPVNRIRWFRRKDVRTKVGDGD